MPTSNSSSKSFVIEAFTASLLMAALCRALWPHDLGLGETLLHPAWLVVLALSARYGPGGLVISLLCNAAIYGGIAHFGLDNGGLEARLTDQVDFLPLVGSTLVALISMSHESRLHRLRENQSHLVDQAASEREWAGALREANAYLRKRCDRMDGSIRLWRRVAHCLERGDLRQAADAALDLCIRRAGARGGYVVDLKNGKLNSLARDQVTDEVWSRDDTLQTTMEDGQPHLVLDLANPDQDDSDVAVPIRDEFDGEVLGAIALWGVDPAMLREAELHDLKLIAEWLAPVVARDTKGPRLRDASGVAVI